MDKTAYIQMANTEKYHWWYVGKRTIIDFFLNTYKKENLKILDIGSGTGENLSMLSKFGLVDAIEKEKTAIEFSKSLSLKNVNILEGEFPYNIPDKVINTKYDIIVMLDVLEHIKEDELALKKLTSLLKKNGIIILTVPAYKWLYSNHDIILHHYRRYSKKEIINKTKHLFNIEKITYFCFFTFPLFILSRLLNKLTKKDSLLGTNIPNKYINKILLKIFSFERFILKYFNFPFGSSMLVVLRYYEHNNF